MAGVHGLEHVERLGAAAQVAAIRPHGRLREPGEGEAAHGVTQTRLDEHVEARGLEHTQAELHERRVGVSRERMQAQCGRGIGHAFFDAREAHARALGRFRMTAFCAVDREQDDPRRPAGHRDNDAFWSRRGYVRRPELRMQLAWDERGRGECEHTLTFWTRALEHSA